MGQEHQECTRGAMERNHHRGKAVLATPAGCRWARGTPEDGKQPGQESHHSIPSVHRHSYCKPASTLMNVSILPLKSL